MVRPAMPPRQSELETARNRNRFIDNQRPKLQLADSRLPEGSPDDSILHIAVPAKHKHRHPRPRHSLTISTSTLNETGIESGTFSIFGNHSVFPPPYIFRNKYSRDYGIPSRLNYGNELVRKIRTDTSGSGAWMNSNSAVSLTLPVAGGGTVT